MYLLMGIYDGGGNYLTAVWRYGDRYAQVRAADKLARSYWGTSPLVYPKLPLIFGYKWEDWISGCQECVYDLKSIDSFDKAFDITVKGMVTVALEEGETWLSADGALDQTVGGNGPVRCEAGFGPA